MSWTAGNTFITLRAFFRLANVPVRVKLHLKLLLSNWKLLKLISLLRSVVAYN